MAILCFFKQTYEILLVHKLYLDNVAESQNLPFKPGHIIAHNKICGFKVDLDFPEIRKFPKAFLTLRLRPKKMWSQKEK